MTALPTPDILCIGSVLWDIIGRTHGPLAQGGDVPGRISRLPGGVALNIAATLAKLGLKPALLSAVGRDGAGDDLVAACTRMGLATHTLYRSDDLPTDVYMAIEAGQGLIAAIADAYSLESAGAKILAPLGDGTLGSASAPWSGMIALDGNLTKSLLADIASSALFARADLRLAPASPSKADRLAPLLRHPGATLYANLDEARILSGDTRAQSAAVAAQALLGRGALRVVVTDGGNPCAEGRAGLGIITATPPQVMVHRVTGAGDTFMAAHIVAERRGADRSTALNAALRAAADYISKEVGS